MHKVIDPSNPAPPAPSDHSQPRKKGGFPVLILHGLFQSSGSFVTSEDRSLAFWLAKQGGYQVYLGNTRGIFDMGHRSWGRNDPRFWGACEAPTSIALQLNRHRLDDSRACDVRSAGHGRACLPGDGIRQSASGRPVPDSVLMCRSPSLVIRKAMAWHSSRFRSACALRLASASLSSSPSRQRSMRDL